MAPMGPEQSDAEAIERSFTEATAFDVIFERHYDSIYAFVTRAVGTDSGADLAQDVFMLAFDQRRRFQTDRASARPWLFGIARNLVRRWYRSEARRLRAYHRDAREVLPADFTADANDRLVADRMRTELRAGLEAIPPDERDAILLFALAELSYAEIADVVHVPVGTVKSRLHRARARLQHLVGQRASQIIATKASD